LASMQPILARTESELEAQNPPECEKRSAGMEYPPEFDRRPCRRVLSNEMPVPKLLNSDSQIRITDDRPYNEYFLVRDFLR